MGVSALGISFSAVVEDGGNSVMIEEGAEHILHSTNWFVVLPVLFLFQCG